MPKSRRGATKKPKTRKPPAANDEWWTIKRILEEKTVRGRVQYLVEWDDNLVTGQAYDPEWVCLDMMLATYMPTRADGHFAN
jgi:hypothetical protein